MRPHKCSCLPLTCGEYGSVGRCKMLRRCSPAVNSPDIIAEPLSVISDRGRPTFCSA